MKFSPSIKLHKILNTVFQNLIYLLFFLPPLISLPFWTEWYSLPKYLTFSILVSVLTILFGFITFTTKTSIVYPKKFFRMMIFYLFSFFISTIFSTHPLTSLLPRRMLYIYHANHIVLLSLMTLIISNWLQKNKIIKLERLSFYITLCLLLTSLYSLFSLIGENASKQLRLTGIEGEANRHALFLIATIPIATSLIMNKQMIYKAIGIAALYFGFLSLMLTYSRSAWMVLIISSLTLFILFYKLIRTYFEKSKIKIKFLLIFIFVNFIIISPLLKNTIYYTFSLIEDVKAKSGSVVIRYEGLKDGLLLYKDQVLSRKIVGLGPNIASYYLNKYKNPDLNKIKSPDERNWRTYIIRNHYLNLLLNNGLLNLVAYLLLIAVSIKHITGEKKLSPIELGYFGMLIVIVYSGLIYYQTVITSSLFWLALSALWVNTDKFEYINSRFISIVTIALGLLLLTYTSMYAFADRFAEKKDLQKAYKLMFWQDEYLKDWIDYLNIKTYSNHSSEDIEKAMNLSETLMKNNPYEINNISSASLAYFRAGVWIDKKYHGKALVLAEKRLELDPSRAANYDRIGQIYLDMGSLETARKYFEKALAVNPDYRGSYLHIGETYKQQQRYDEARNYYRQAVEMWPDWQMTRDELIRLEEKHK